MSSGVYQAKKKNGSVFFRSSLTYRGKHISLGSFDTDALAQCAYQEAASLLNDESISIDSIRFADFVLPHEKLVTLLNFRDNRIYIKNPIYLMRTYFNYYLTPTEIYKFDNDDLFYYSEHKLLKRGGHLFVNDYGMQVTILSRYGIHSHAVQDRDYRFANHDPYDLRYSNVININPYYGVRQDDQNGIITYNTYLHINGEYHIGCYGTVEDAAIAYNKAVDLAHQYGITKSYPTNYLAEMSASHYAQRYVEIKVSARYKKYLQSLSGNSSP